MKIEKKRTTAAVVLNSRAKEGSRGGVWVRGTIAGDPTSLTLRGDCAVFLRQAEKGGVVTVEGVSHIATGRDDVERCYITVARITDYRHPGHPPPRDAEAVKETYPVALQDVIRARNYKRFKAMVARRSVIDKMLRFFPVEVDSEA